MSQPPGDLIGIGDLARRAGLTTKALRHYDATGLFRPAYVDSANYRWYTPDQVERARLIARLRAVDLPLDVVRECLDADPQTAHKLVQAHRLRLDARLARVQRQLHRLSHLLDSGTDSDMTHDPSAQFALDTEQHRAMGKAYFNGTWDLMVRDDRSRADDDTMIHMAHASRYHWGLAGTPAHLARGEWLCSRVYATLGRAEPAAYHAQRVVDLCDENGIRDWDLAFGYEALARASAVAGDGAAARSYTEQALHASEEIAEDDDRDLLLTDLESIPGQQRFW